MFITTAELQFSSSNVTEHSLHNDNDDNNVLVLLADMLEALQHLAHLLLMHSLQLSISNTITEHDNTVRQDTIHLVEILQST